MAKRLKKIKAGRVTPKLLGMQDQRFNFYHWMKKMHEFGIKILEIDNQYYKI